MRFENKVALITGAASGIGKATAEHLAREGALVVIADRAAEQAAAVAAELEASGHRARPLTLDVTDSDAIGVAVAGLVGELGRIDILVNNAGYGIAGTVTETSAESWRNLFEVNVTGVFLMSNHVVPRMIEQGGGVVVNVASTGALVGIRDRAAYCASKGAVAALTRCMALDHAAQNVRVNAVCPGTIDTPYHDEIQKSSADPSTFKAALASRQVLNRLGTVDEIAAAIAYLASDDASFSTGSLLVVDGGMTAQ